MRLGFERQGYARVDKTQQDRQRYFAEFLSDLRRFPPAMGLTELTVGPEYILAWLEKEFIPRHVAQCRTLLPDGSKVCSASLISSVLSHLSTSFEEVIGRRGPYVAAQPSVGNPCDSPIISLYRKGYKKALVEQGVVELGAIPMTAGKVQQLVQGCRARAASSQDSRIQLVYRRDALLWLYLWQSWQRGREAGQLTCSRLRWTSAGVNVSLGALKASQLAVFSGSDFYAFSQSEFSFADALREFTRFCEGLGIDLAHGEGYIFRPLARDGSVAFETATPLTSDAMYERLIGELKEFQLYEGESVHSFRRGADRHAKDSGMSQAERMAKGRWASSRTEDRYSEGPSKRFKPLNGSG